MGVPKNDLTGQKFGKLVVIKYIGDSKWECLCDCGKKTFVKTSSLKSEKTKSCGCLRGYANQHLFRNSKPKQNLTGKTFGYLTALYYIKGGKWHCKCKCGKEIDVDTRNLNSGHTLSCGCYQKEKVSSLNLIDMTGYEDDNFIVLERKDNSWPVYWKCICKHCGRIFSLKGTNIRNGVSQSCGCAHSRGEQRIIKMLQEANCNFAKEYTFPDLVGDNKGKLRFDFAIFKDNKLSHLIEYNGIQHYEKAQGSWANSFESLQNHDRKKIEYCKTHNIPLKIIRYDEDFTINDLINVPKLEPVETIP